MSVDWPQQSLQFASLRSNTVPPQRTVKPFSLLAYPILSLQNAVNALRQIAFNSVNISAPLLFLGPVTAGWMMPAGKPLKTAVVWLSLSDTTNTSSEPELHLQVLQLPSVAESPRSGLKIEAVLWHQCMQRSPSQWEVSMHKHPLLSLLLVYLALFSHHTQPLFRI